MPHGRKAPRLAGGTTRLPGFPMPRGKMPRGANYRFSPGLFSATGWTDDSRPPSPCHLSCRRPRRLRRKTAWSRHPRRARGGGGGADTTVEDVRAVLTRYFKVWSDKDMAAYEALFDPGATIHFVQEGGQVVPWPVPPFIEAQRQAHAAATAPMVETAERMEIHVSPDGRAAQAAVKWRLLEGNEVTIGWDHFTLLRQEKGWRILNLVFYKE